MFGISEYADMCLSFYTIWKPFRADFENFQEMCEIFELSKVLIGYKMPWFSTSPRSPEPFRTRAPNTN